MFMQIAQRSGGIDPLLKSFFGFLHRRTDFYVEHAGKAGVRYEAGFPTGKAEAMVAAAFKGYPHKPLEGSAIEQSAGATRQTVEAKAAAKKAKAAAKAAAPAAVAPPAPSSSGPDAPYEGVRYTEGGLQEPIGNGGVTDSHTWVQDINVLTATFDVPEATTSKAIRCDLGAKRGVLCVNGETLFDGAWYDAVASPECVWTIDRSVGRASVVITLEKSRETWWKSLLKDAPKRDHIDCQKVDSTKKMDEYDDSTQAAIRKIMFDQRQKQKGEPTSDELKMNAILDSAADLPNSPFKRGDPYPKLHGAAAPPDLDPPAPPAA